VAGIILPEASIGVIGGGQLGRMLSNAAQTLGYKVVIWSEEKDCPACQVATKTIIGKYSDERVLKEFLEAVDVVTIETEHIPLHTLHQVETVVPLYPSANIVGIAQNRKMEKLWLKKNGFPVVPFQLVSTIEDVIEFKRMTDEYVVVKTITGGYDGKGQLLIQDPNLSLDESKQIRTWLEARNELIVEEWIPVEKELSVIGARNQHYDFAHFPAVENDHKQHILHQTIAPARINQEITMEAMDITKEVMEKMEYTGLLCVEFFYSKKGQLYVNELAPRPHNSGHYTLDAAVTSQFEQTIRAICGLPLGDTRLLTPSVMTNLLGDLWIEEFKAINILNNPSTKLHLYGKKEAKLKRKMGHFTTLAGTIEKAIEDAKRIYHSLN